ncbi:MAG: DUF3267 domain-containing protein [Mariniphaga sp.]
MNNPDVEELQNNDKYELMYELEHQQVKEFVINQITSGGRIVKGYMIYQLLMILIGMFFATRPIVLAIRGDYQPLFYLFIAILVTFTLLILIHELLHALAFKITGARKVSIGSYFKKFIFYAEADRHVLNRKQFTLVALTPFLTVKAITLAGVIITLGHPVMYFWIFVMSAHSLFCAGDIGMLDYFYRHRDSNLFTFDLKAEKKSYFYRQTKTAPKN